MSQHKVVTRFPPSPTGSLHVGGARTALYNWAFARRHGGSFILRFEDTDRARSTTASALEILAALDWLGMDWDEGPRPHAADPMAEQLGPNGPYVSSQRLAIYDEHVQRLLTSDRAYEDDGAIRFRMPDEDVIVHDMVLGDVTVRSGEIDDFVIRKGDGFPTYHLAVVVDDAAMGVTHVIRGQEHLNNAPKHRALQAALGLPVPVFAHIPLIFNPDGSKMGKRDKAKAARAAARAWIEDHGDDEGAFRDLILGHSRPGVDDLGQSIDRDAVAQFVARQSDDIHVAQRIADALEVPLPEIDVVDFKSAGYLPNVLCNYLALLGWNPGGDEEHFDNAFLCQHFSLERVGKSNAKFDRAKLASFSQQALAEMTPEAWARRLFVFDDRYPARFDSAADHNFIAFAAAYQVRSVTLADPARLGAFFFIDTDKLVYDDEKALAKVMLKGGGEGFRVLGAVRPVLAGVETWAAETVHAAIEAFATANELGLGKVAQPIRFAVSGTTATPPIDATLAILGREATLARIDRCLAVAPRAVA